MKVITYLMKVIPDTCRGHYICVKTGSFIQNVGINKN